jgi:hypothetical protein
MTGPERHDRYPGARPFLDTDIDHRLFFGRDREINDLFYQVLGTDLLVLFGKSGLGKTSLLQAGIFPRLRERELLPLPVRLNRTELLPGELFTTAIAEMCRTAGIDYTPGETGSLWEFFKTAVFWRGEALQTPVLGWISSRRSSLCKTPPTASESPGNWGNWSGQSHLKTISL